MSIAGSEDTLTPSATSIVRYSSPHMRIQRCWLFQIRKRKKKIDESRGSKSVISSHMLFSRSARHSMILIPVVQMTVYEKNQRHSTSRNNSVTYVHIHVNSAAAKLGCSYQTVWSNTCISPYVEKGSIFRLPDSKRGLFF